MEFWHRSVNHSHNIMRLSLACYIKISEKGMTKKGKPAEAGLCVESWRENLGDVLLSSPCHETDQPQTSE
jgi:hypothetical protein